MLQGQKKDRRTVYDPIVREARKAVQRGKAKKGERREAHAMMRLVLQEELS
jgi:hypothetical protein